jgi:formylglycine-generating enzyme
VGSFPANNYGLYDMAGNVGELCNDWYSDSYYSSSPYNNPTGPISGTVPVIRGGSWYQKAYVCRISSRNFNGYPGTCSSMDGFRIVLNF